MSMDITLLTDEQMWGDTALQVIYDCGTKVGMSDLAILLGGSISDTLKTRENQSSGYIWSPSSTHGYVCSFFDLCNPHYTSPQARFCSVRPVLPSSVTSSIPSKEVKSGKPIKNKDGYVIWGDVVEYGEYPQTMASEEVGKELEQALGDGKLQTTGKKYTFDAEEDNDKPFMPKEHAEYQHGDKRYIRVEARLNTDKSVLLNGHKPQRGEPCWIEVQPIEWLKDPSGIWLVRQTLFAGIQFDRNEDYDGDFEKTDMKQYLQNYFAKEMQPSRGMDAPPVVGRATESINARREAQRRRALEDYTQGL